MGAVTSGSGVLAESLGTLVVGREGERCEMDAREAVERLEKERERLITLRKGLELEGVSEESETESVSEVASASQHPADLGTETFERERALSMREELEAELAEIDDAIRRVTDGRYGRCERCDASIPDERLAAVPATRFCKHHEDDFETLGGLPELPGQPA
jgi:RNA polymerase-binding transcription factor DksA